MRSDIEVCCLGAAYVCFWVRVWVGFWSFLGGGDVVFYGRALMSGLGVGFLRSVVWAGFLSLLMSAFGAAFVLAHGGFGGWG